MGMRFLGKIGGTKLKRVYDLKKHRRGIVFGSHRQGKKAIVAFPSEVDLDEKHKGRDRYEIEAENSEYPKVYY